MPRNQARELVTPGRLADPFVVLRRVDVAPLSVRVTRAAPTTMEMIGSGYAEAGLEERELVWFNDGLILNDQPRTSILTDEIVKHTIGFAVARTDTGEVVREFGPDGLAKAEASVKGARLEIVADVALEDDGEPEDVDTETEPDES